MKITINRIGIFLAFIGIFGFVGPRQAASALTTSVDYEIFLPLVLSRAESPFWLEIAAIHQVQPGMSLVERQISEAEYKELIAEAYPTLINALVESGAGGTRIDLKWGDIEPNPPVNGQPTYSWSWYDDRLVQIGGRGIKTIITITDPPGWAATAFFSPIFPDRLDEFARFLTDLVNRYKVPPYNVEYWELFNEPDNTGYWGQVGDQYANMLSVAYPAIKAADPGAVVFQGGIAYDWFVDESPGVFERYFIDDVMAAGGGAFIDVLNFHYFEDFHAEWERWGPSNMPTCGLVNDGIGNTYQAGGIDVIAKASHFRNRMNTCYGIDKPVWQTEAGEHGFPGDPNSLADQANYVIKGNVRSLAAGVTNIIWYALTTPNEPFQMELLYDDWTPKPAFYTFKTLTHELRGYTYHHTLNVPGVEGYAFQDPSQLEKTVAWGTGTITFDQTSQLRVVDRDGNVTIIQDGGSGDLDGTVNNSIRFQLTNDPVFLQK